MPRRKKVVDDAIYTIKISGTSYDALGEGLPIAPVSQRAVGGLGGKQYTFEVGRADLETICNLMMIKACDLAEEYGDGNYRTEQIYKDADRLPEVVRPR